VVEHWNGRAWHLLSGPIGAIGDRLAGVAAAKTRLVAVGSGQDPDGLSIGLADTSAGRAWTIVKAANPGTARNELSGLTTLERGDALAVGLFGDRDRPTRTLVERQTASGWIVEPSPNVGTLDNRLSGAAAAPDGSAWAVGYRQGSSAARTLIERRCG
jgi:hypothetical protein